MPCLVSIDVEDWFHILDLPSTPPVARWNEFPSHVEKNFRRMLEIVERSGARVTCFVLGWIAQRFPHLVLEAHAAGHEIASHGFAHELVYQQGRTRFRRDIVKAKQILEDLIGEPVLGYRAPGFSVTDKSPWFFEVSGGRLSP